MDISRTPLHSRHVELGARMVPFSGWDMPVQYLGLMEEHRCVRNNVGLFDVSHMGEVFVRGPNALKAVQWLISNDASRLQDGQALYTVMCNEMGGVVDDLVVYRLKEDVFLICVNAGNRKKDFEWMINHNPFNAQITDESDAWGQIAVQGPKALPLMERLFDGDLAGLGAFHSLSGCFAGVDGCLVARTGYTGEDGFEVFTPAGDTVAVWDALLETGVPLGVQPIGLGARDTLRLEARFCLYGHELTDETSPWQAGLAWVTKMDKPDGFIGHEVLLKRKGNESHRLVGLLIDGKRIPRAEMKVQKEEQDVGWVTSGTRSPTCSQGIALAYVRREFARVGTELSIDVRGREAPCRVVKGAFHTN